MEFLPEIVPVLISVLNDATPAVARQGISSGIDLFRSTLMKIAIQVNLSLSIEILGIFSFGCLLIVQT